MRCAVPNDSEYKASYIKLPQSGVQQRQRDDRAPVYRHADKNDAARAIAIDPAPQQRRAHPERDGRDCEASGDGFATPTEFRGQRFHKNRKRLDEQRAESGHDTETGRQNYPPAVVANIEFSQDGCDFSATHWIDAPFRKRYAGVE